MESSNTESAAESSNLPSECWSVVASYLPLADCLRFGSTSLSALRDIQSDLARRRRHMTCTFYYTDLQELSVYSSYKLKEEDTGEHVLHHLPSVRERIQCLYSTLPPTYRQCDAVRELLLEMSDESGNINGDRDSSVDDFRGMPACNAGEETSFLRLFGQLQKNMKSHKLHASILASAIRSSPQPYDESVRCASQRTALESVLTVTLQQYIGDVLCAYFLMGHSISGIVEGGPSEQGWMRDLLSELKLDDESLGPNATPRSCANIAASVHYRLWIFFHSTNLRIAPFTHTQQLQLGIASPGIPNASSLMPRNRDAGPLLPPHFPFCGTDKKPVLQRVIHMGPHNPLRIKFNDFGPLGPAFRGRDLVHSQTIYPSSAFSAIVAYEGMPTQRYTNPATLGLNRFLVRRIAGEDDSVAWMLHLHQEAQKTRPMTVEPHLVTIFGGSAR